MPKAVGEGRWNLDALERLVDQRRQLEPDRVEEWETYLFLLREHATVDGALPPSFDALVADVFGPADR